MREGIVFFLVVFGAFNCASADMASTTYVDERDKLHVSTSKDSTQTMAGKYTVSGTLEVPTPDLPTPQQ